MYNIDTGKVMTVFSAHEGPTTMGHFVPPQTGKSVLTCSADGSVIQWSPVSGDQIFRLSTKGDARYDAGGWNCMAVDANGNLAVVGGLHAARACVINLQGRRITQTLDLPSNSSREEEEGSVEAVAFCDAFNILALGCLDGSIQLYDTTLWRIRHTVKHDDAVVSLKFARGTPYLFSCSVDSTVRRWDVRTGKETNQWKGHREGVLAFALSSDGQTVATAGDDGVSLVFRV